MNVDEGSRCQIRRIGTVVSIEQDLVRIEVEGKPLGVPSAKCDSRLRPGDVVAWDGGRWIVSDQR
ncbi:hypothetical protein [Cohnella yongneupensis]|uniref:Uncharacterized protein n=1 Tax=Cohnella yongneupensis TaxID=425006 RepID=A0ABW0QZL2_9BACL